MDQYPVNQTSYVVFRPGQNQPISSVNNSGTVPLYLDSQPQLSTTQGALLNVGAITPWQEHLPLYVVCPTGTGLLSVTDNPVGYWDSFSIAGALIGQGLAQLIATAISLTGAPPLNIVAPLINLVGSTPNVLGGGTTQTVSVVPYQSIRLFWNDGLTINAPGPSATTRKITINWFDAAGNNIYAGNPIFTVGNDTDPYAYNVYSATGYLDVVLQPPFAAASMSVTYEGITGIGYGILPTLLVSGSYRSMGVTRVRNGSLFMVNTSGTVVNTGLYGTFDMTPVAGGGATTTDYPLVSSGMGTFSMAHKGGGTLTVDAAIIDFKTAKRTYTLGTAGTGAELTAVTSASASMPVLLGGNPIIVICTPRGNVPTGLVVTLSMAIA